MHGLQAKASVLPPTPPPLPPAGGGVTQERMRLAEAAHASASSDNTSMTLQETAPQPAPQATAPPPMTISTTSSAASGRRKDRGRAKCLARHGNGSLLARPLPNDSRSGQVWVIQVEDVQARAPGLERCGKSILCQLWVCHETTGRDEGVKVEEVVFPVDGCSPVEYMVELSVRKASIQSSSVCGRGRGKRGQRRRSSAVCSSMGHGVRTIAYSSL